MFQLLGQQSVPPPDVYIEPSLFDVFGIGLIGILFWILPLALKIWMAVECLRKDPDRYLWLWIIILVPFGSVVYFFIRWIPNNEIRLPTFMQQWTRGREIDRLRLAAIQIGNPHQHILLGDALREIKQHAEAGEAYAEALEKEPANLQALWGAAQVHMHFSDFESARDHLRTILDIDPQYKFGDVSFAYGQSLAELDRPDAAIEHLEEHVRRWPQPEALYALACLLADEGNHQQARTHLQSMLLGINSSPRGIARKNAMWKSKGKRLLRRLNNGR